MYLPSYRPGGRWQRRERAGNGESGESCRTRFPGSPLSGQSALATANVLHLLGKQSQHMQRPAIGVLSHTDWSGMKTILVVEDNSNMRIILGTLLEARGFHVTLCEDGASADDLLEQSVFDVILVDLYMPGKSGLDVTKTIRKRNDRVCIIGMSLENRVRDFLDAGADAFLEKPFDIGDLTRIINDRIRINA